jgi:hypothetical protein
VSFSGSQLPRSDYGQGVVYGTFLIGSDLAEWRDVHASELGNPPVRDIGARFRRHLRLRCGRVHPHRHSATDGTRNPGKEWKALLHADRVASLTLISTSPALPSAAAAALPRPSDELSKRFAEPLPEPDWRGMADFRRRLRYDQARWREANRHPVGSRVGTTLPRAGQAAFTRKPGRCRQNA